MTWRVHVVSSIPQGYAGAKILLVKEDEHGVSYVSGPLTMKAVAPGDTIPDSDATFSFNYFEMEDLLRAFADAAWEKGIKPTRWDDHGDELKATKYHLEDMRKIVFK